MKKVLFVATITKHILDFHTQYLKWFKEQGYQVHVASNGDEPIAYCDKHFNLPFERFPFKKNNLKVYNQLKEIINENNYQIIHCHTPVGGVLTRLAAKKARKNGTKVIYTAHGFHFYKGAPLLNWLIYYPIEKIMAKYTDCLITITEEDYEFAKRKLKKVKSIEHIDGVGMNTEKFDVNINEEEKLKIKQELNIDSYDIVLSYVAELNNNKNQKLLIDSIENIIKTNKNIKLLLIGDGVYREEYKKYIEERNLQNNVFLLGRRRDIPQLLSITDIYVASSIREGLPVNIMEAMYMGLPIVATDNRGHRELVLNNKNGYIVESNNNPHLMADKIKEFINDKTKIKEFGNKGRELSKKYQILNVLEKMKKIYQSNGR